MYTQRWRTPKQNACFLFRWNHLLTLNFVYHMTGLESDGCNTMMARIEIVWSRLEDACCPGVCVMHCRCRSAHLCVSEACRRNPDETEHPPPDAHNTVRTLLRRLAHFAYFQEYSIPLLTTFHQPHTSSICHLWHFSSHWTSLRKFFF